MCLWADQILCSTNKDKDEINKAVREYKGFKSQIPEVGDKLMCLKNNWENNVLNLKKEYPWLHFALHAYMEDLSSGLRGSRLGLAESRQVLDA